ncbi:peroxisome assembly protein 26 [Rhinatrema bivittatum]|uniref:peroxisome assembly protein 26 n=1 Tax=Rhinatrema bivittatum TaxID=194408 RepID=UPI001126BE31|nr:peroxisome assembly protein 26 [Rhinatrema bivittatum]XP_029455671.1 peroxisome assembly protein 26 [Rhinatrema bivittatum]
MRNDSCTSLVGLRGSGSSMALYQTLALLEDAADLLMVHRDFSSSLELCKRGCETIAAEYQNGEDCRCEDVKASLCIVGMQALAEMNRWREVLSWLLQYYKLPEKLPLKIFEMCILLYSKVEEPHVMLEVGSGWLRDEGNQSLAGYGMVAELYLSQVLLPLGQFAEAESLAKDCCGFSKEQRATALRAVRERQQQWEEPGAQEKSLKPTKEEQRGAGKELQAGNVPKSLVNSLKLLRRVLGSAMSCLHSIPFKRVVLAALIVYLVLLRLDAAAPPSHPFIYMLVQLFRQMWFAVFPVRATPPVTI